MKQQKVYIAIALYKDAEPQIIGLQLGERDRKGGTVNGKFQNLF